MKGCSVATTHARIQVWRSQSTRTVSAFLNITGIVRPFGWVRLNVGFSVLTLWRLWRRGSLLRNSTVPPTGTMTTLGAYTHPCWSTCTGFVDGSHLFPGGGWTDTTAQRIPRLAPRTRSSASLLLPHTYWSMLMGIIFFSGAGPA